MPDYTGGQFPSLDGNSAAEVAQRTEPDTEGNWFRKVFTVHNRAHTVGLPNDHEVHRNNAVAVVQAALQQGLHPKSVPELESESGHWDDKHTLLTYRVQVVPAVADDDPASTVTPSALANDTPSAPFVYPETPLDAATEDHAPVVGREKTQEVPEVVEDLTED